MVDYGIAHWLLLSLPEQILTLLACFGLLGISPKLKWWVLMGPLFTLIYFPMRSNLEIPFQVVMILPMVVNLSMMIAVANHHGIKPENSIRWIMEGWLVMFFIQGTVVPLFGGIFDLSTLEGVLIPAYIYFTLLALYLRLRVLPIYLHKREARNAGN